MVDFTSPAPRRGGGRTRRAAVLEMGVAGIKADDGEGYYVPPDGVFADGRTRRRGRVGVRRPVSPGDAGRARRGPSRRGRSVRQAGLDGPAGDRDHVGRRPGLRLVVAQDPCDGQPHRGGIRLFQLVARRRRLPRRAPGQALPQGAPGALGSLRSADAADAGARALRPGGVALRRRDASRIPRSRSSSTSAWCPTSARRPGRPPGPACRSCARSVSWSRTSRARGQSAMPTGSALRCGWRRCSKTALASGGPTCRRASGSTSGAASRYEGGQEVTAVAPLDRVPIWVRRGSIIVTYSGRDRPPRAGGLARRRAAARSHALRRAALRAREGGLADGTDDRAGAAGSGSALRIESLRSARSSPVACLQSRRRVWVVSYRFDHPERLGVRDKARRNRAPGKRA